MQFNHEHLNYRYVYHTVKNIKFLNYGLRFFAYRITLKILTEFRVQHSSLEIHHGFINRMLQSPNEMQFASYFNNNVFWMCSESWLLPLGTGKGKQNSQKPQTISHCSHLIRKLLKHNEWKLSLGLKYYIFILFTCRTSINKNGMPYQIMQIIYVARA